MNTATVQTAKHQTASRKRANRQLLLMYVLLIFILFAGGSSVLERLRTAVKHAVGENLAAIGTLKEQQIEGWIAARQADVEVLSGDVYFVRSWQQWMRGGKRDKALATRLNEQLQSYNRSHQFRAVAIFDQRGNVLLQEGLALDDVGHMGDAAKRAIGSHGITLVDLHRHADNSIPFGIGFIAPLAAQGREAGVIYFVEDPERYLFPLLLRWPVNSASAETQLVRAEGDRVLFLGELRKRDDKPLTFSLPLNTPDLAAAIALHGKRGVFDAGRDYAGTPVLSFATGIRDMPWVLIAKIDRAEAFALVDKVETVAMWAALLLFVSSGAWFWQWLRHEQHTADADVLRERLRADEVRLLGEKRFRAVFEHTAMPMARIAPDGLFLEVNDSWCVLFDYSCEEALNQQLNLYQLMLPEDATSLQAMTDKLLKAELEIYRCENKFLRRDLKELWGNLQISLVRNERGEPDYFICAIQDITEQKQAEQLIHFMAYHDKLTGLPNRALLFDRLSQAMSRAKRDGKSLALLFVDLDGFKHVNDEFGHEAGDAVLKSAARRFLSSVRAADTVARLGGDEFAIILGDLTAPEQAASVAEKIVRAFDHNITLPEGGECRVGASVGISLFPEHGSAIDSLISAADHAMYRSKKSGKGSYTFFKETRGGSDSPWIIFDDKHLIGIAEIDEQHRNLVYLVNRINDALKSNESAEAIALMFDELLVATAHHFDTETRYMKNHHYPEQTEHEQEHAHLVSEAQQFKKQLDQGRELLVLQSIKDWLLGHIVFSDKKLGRFLIQIGVR